MISLLQTAITNHKQQEAVLRELKGSFESVRINSKNAIALLRRDHTDEAKKLLQEAENTLKTLQASLQKDPFLLEQGMYKEALEEYAEAMFFAAFVLDQKYSFPEFVLIAPQEILGGMCDFTGELVRRAVSRAHPDNITELENYKQVMEDIIQELTQVGLRRKLRQKYDDVERNLKRMEGILYDIRLTQMRKS